ncbi:hypothetical protein LY76DRAFT_237710 [Colletotrichum caudatum]|nr:hypothetical protein LY76DRAFT_237710 [Colletotrichum caudatum]
MLKTMDDNLTQPPSIVVHLAAAQLLVSLPFSLAAIGANADATRAVGRHGRGDPLVPQEVEAVSRAADETSQLLRRIARSPASTWRGLVTGNIIKLVGSRGQPKQNFEAVMSNYTFKEPGPQSSACQPLIAIRWTMSTALTPRPSPQTRYEKLSRLQTLQHCRCRYIEHRFPFSPSSREMQRVMRFGRSVKSLNVFATLVSRRSRTRDCRSSWPCLVSRLFSSSISCCLFHFPILFSTSTEARNLTFPKHGRLDVAISMICSQSAVQFKIWTLHHSSQAARLSS